MFFTCILGFGLFFYGCKFSLFLSLDFHYKKKSRFHSFTKWKATEEKETHAKKGVVVGFRHLALNRWILQHDMFFSLIAQIFSQIQGGNGQNKKFS